MAACFLRETSTLSQSVVMSTKARAIRRLNGMLGSEAHLASDEVIAAVVKLVNTGLSYGETEHVRMHLGGLREMVQIRGGLASLGMGGLIGQMATT